mmetsp:Transcript_21704/g.51879  ORF Transcript_21704/g.51879 Transcript_21704/m.51879 type:complete len:409 (-) Transcript_21704:66-1292(-)
MLHLRTVHHRLGRQLLHLLPGEHISLAAEVPICGSALVLLPLADGLEVELTANETRAEVKALLDGLQDLLVRDRPSAIGVHVDREGLSHTDGIGDLEEAATGEAGGNDRLRHLAGNVGARPVDLGGVLSGEGTAAVCAPTAVGVNDDLTASETGIAVGSANHKAARGVQMVDGVVIKVLGRDNRLNDMLHQVSMDLVIAHAVVVLSGDKDGVHADGDHGTILILVLNSDLGLAVRTEPGADAILADLSELVAELGCQHVGEGHELGGLIRGIAKHMTLVTSTNLLQCLGAHAMDTLANVRRLLVDVHKNLALVAVQAHIIRDEANLTADAAHNCLVIHLGLGGDLTKHHHHVGLSGCLTSNLAVRVLLKAGIEHCVGDLIRKLIGMSLVNGLGSEEEGLDLRHVWNDR